MSLRALPIFSPHYWELQIPALLHVAIAILPLLLSILVGWAAYAILIRILRRLRNIRRHNIEAHILPHIAAPLRWTIIILTFSASIDFTGLNPEWKDHLNQFTHPLLIGVIGWLAVGVVMGATERLAQRFAWKNIENNLAFRRLSTQLRVFRNIAVFFIIAITAIVIAMSIPALHNLGLSLFASAGVAGIVGGMAARPALSNLIAGIQLALTQPIRLDDVVIVEGEWGRIQEINSSYVVVAIWDQRRMVVPLSYFIEKPFQNWTLTTSQLMGTVLLYLDYTAPIDAIRTELERILNTSKLWDKRVGIAQVTDTKERTVEVRLLVSARNSSDLFDLRCNVREGVIAFLQREYPGCLPRTRAEISGTVTGQTQGPA